MSGTMKDSINSALKNRSAAENRRKLEENQFTLMLLERGEADRGRDDIRARHSQMRAERVADRQIRSQERIARQQLRLLEQDPQRLAQQEALKQSREYDEDMDQSMGIARYFGSGHSMPSKGGLGYLLRLAGTPGPGSGVTVNPPASASDGLGSGGISGGNSLFPSMDNPSDEAAIMALLRGRR